MRLYVYAIICAALLSLWLLDRSHQYKLGVVEGTNVCTQAAAAYSKQLNDRLEKEKADASIAADKAAAIINTYKTRKDEEEEKQRKLNKKHPVSASCNLSDDELHRFNEAINSIQR